MTQAEESVRAQARATVVTGTSYVREVNSRAILRVLRDQREPMTLTDLVHATGLSRPSLEGGLDDLNALGWVEESSLAPATSRGGRPARRFRFRGEVGYVAGIDVGPNKVDMQLADLTGDVFAASRMTPPPGVELTPVVVHRAAVDFMAEHAVEGRRLQAITVGVPGVVDRTGELSDSFVLPHWERRPIRAELERLFGVPVTLENDANLATLTEFRLGVGQGADSMVYLMLGNRISAGAIIQQRLLRGSHGAAGEVGSLPRERWQEPLAALAAALGSSDLGAGGDVHVIDEVFRRAAAGDRDMQGLVEVYVEEVVVALLALTLSIDPDVVVVGGGVARAGDALFTPLRTALARHPLAPAAVRRGQYADDAVVIGAIQSALRYLDEHVYGLG